MSNLALEKSKLLDSGSLDGMNDSSTKLNELTNFMLFQPIFQTGDGAFYDRLAMLEKLLLLMLLLDGGYSEEMIPKLAYSYENESSY
nr:hypothetical protein Iba_chr01bCG7940 [Ipomoea batatas]